MTKPDCTKRIEMLDYGRFIAAGFVLLFHYTYNGFQNGKISSIVSPFEEFINITKYGYLGVEFFFMISGYVIFISARNRTATDFAVSRLVRLYPAFWTAVLFTASVAVFFGGSNMSVTPTQVIANLTMIPAALGFDYVDGVYWTLFLEIKFYALVFLILLFGLKAKMETLFLFWPMLMGVAYITGYQHVLFLGGYYTFFAAGAVFAIARKRNDLSTVISLAFGFAMCLLFSTSDVRPGFSSEIIGGVITIFFIFFLFMNSIHSSRLYLPKARLVGAMTYPIYLIHAHFGYMLISGFANDRNMVLIYLLVIGTVFLLAYLTHRLIEVQLAAFWRNLFQKTIGTPLTRIEKLLRGLYVSVIKSS